MKLACALILVASTASAGPKPCDVAAPVLIEVRTIDLTANTSHVTTLRTSGAWTQHDLDKAKKETHPVKGCAKEKELKDVTAALAKAKWKVTTAKVHCMAVATSMTEYAIKDKVVWTNKLCSGQTLDTDSAAAVDLIDQTVSSLK